jgi:hypothetical protein
MAKMEATSLAQLIRIADKIGLSGAVGAHAQR